MDKTEFQRRLERAGERARKFAEHYVIETLPTQLLFTLSEFDDPQGKHGPEGTLKYFGGRFLSPADLKLVTPRRAAALLWVDGKVPGWINVYVDGVHATATHIFLSCGHGLVPADEQKLPRDLPMAVDKTDPIEPFRIRSPRLPNGWWVIQGDPSILVQQDKRFSLLEKKWVD
jgi:hypothetical protein